MDLFGRHMEHLIRYTIAPESRHTGDQLHYLFRALAEEKQPDPAYCASVSGVIRMESDRHLRGN